MSSIIHEVSARVLKATGKLSPEEYQSYLNQHRNRGLVSVLGPVQGTYKEQLGKVLKGKSIAQDRKADQDEPQCLRNDRLLLLCDSKSIRLFRRSALGKLKTYPSQHTQDGGQRND